jgi:AcrR family transcriptional regulator
VIAEAALRITDESGLSGLSMRKLGGELGVEAMSLYHYVASKDDLLDALLELLFTRIELPYDIEADRWEEAIRTGLRSFNDVLMAHQAAVELFTTRPVISPAGLKVLNWAYDRFELMGLTPAESTAAFRFAVSFVIGHAASERGVSAVVEGADGLQVVGVDDPAAAEMLLAHAAQSVDELFEAGLDLVVAGLKASYDRLS